MPDLVSCVSYYIWKKTEEMLDVTYLKKWKSGNNTYLKFSCMLACA